MKILWFNWRDIKNPEAGGAEVYTHEIAKRLVKKGHSVTLFTAEFNHCRQEETVDGVNIVRRGGKYRVYGKAREYWKKNRDFDVVIDEINTRPFLTPKYVDREKIIALIHQLAREFWFLETPFPVSLMGYHFLENYWLKHYRSVSTITVSESTKHDLDQLGFKKVSIVHNGLDIKPLENIPEKSERPTIIFLGRMKNTKKPQDVVEAFRLIKKEVKDAQLWMVGDGYLRRKLEGKDKDVKFFGFVSNETRLELLKKAWVIAVPGIREGWGQVVTQAKRISHACRGLRHPGLKRLHKARVQRPACRRRRYSGFCRDNNKGFN